MHIRTLLRRSLSLFKRLYSNSFSTARILYYRAAFPAIALPLSAFMDRGSSISATDGGTIKFGKNVNLGRDSQVIAGGGQITIGDNVHIGTGTIIACAQSVEIGQDTLIAEYVVVRDQDHSLVSRPIRSAGFQMGAIAIGEDCWLGAKSTVLRGSIIGNGAVIGAHSLVRGNVPAHTLAVGCPAKIVKELPAHE